MRGSRRDCELGERLVSTLSPIAVGVAILLSFGGTPSAGQTLADKLPQNVPFTELTGNWQFIPIPLPDRDVRHILVSKGQDRIWVGTSGGVASYDGIAARTPKFASIGARQAIRVNSMVETRDGSLLIGSSNDSVWLWKGETIVNIFGDCPGAPCPTGDWTFASDNEGSIYVASERFGLQQKEALAKLKQAIPDHLVVVQAPASFLGFAGEKLIATSQSGAISVVDKSSGKATPLPPIMLPPGSNFVRNVSKFAGTIFVGTDTGCVAVRLDEKPSTETLAEGNCGAIYKQRDGTVWLSTDSVYRRDPSGWKRWTPGRSGPVTATAVVDDDRSNVWIGSTLGLWRYFDVSRNRDFGIEVSSMASDANGGLIVGLKNDEVWRLNRAFEATKLDIPVAKQAPSSPYYHGALLASGPDGRLWILTAAGLFAVSGEKLDRIEDYPLPIKDLVVPSSLTTSAGGKVCVGLEWAPVGLCLQNGSWKKSVEATAQVGGAAISAVAFDDAGSLLAVGMQSVVVVADDTKEIGPFDLAPFARKHLFGAIAITTAIKGVDVVASGGWGGTVLLKKEGKEYSVVPRSELDLQEEPYIIRQLAVHPTLGVLAASDAGLFRWEGTPKEGGWRSLRELDPRLSLPINGILPSTGRSFWEASGSRVTLIDLPTAEPTVTLNRTPAAATIETNAVTYAIAVPGLVGNPSANRTNLAYDPPIANAPDHLQGSDNRLDLSNLFDWTRYRVTTTVTDGFLNVGPSVTSDFAVWLPFFRNPYELGAAILLGIALTGLLLTRRGPTGFVLRRVGGLEWSTDKSDLRYAIEITDIGEDLVRFALKAPSEITPVQFKDDLPSARLDGTPKEVLPRLVSMAEGKLRTSSEEFCSEIDRVAPILGGEALPQNLRFVTSQPGNGAMSVDLSKSLLWLPVELAEDGAGGLMQLKYAIGRTISADVLAQAKPPRSSRLRVAVFAPRLPEKVEEQVGADLPNAAVEAKAVADAARSWGAEVTLICPEATKAEVLEALCSSHFFHYAGHAEFLPDAAGESYLPILNDRISAEDVGAALRAKPHNLILAFINGCGTSREATWERGTQVYGFASAFVTNAAYFIGAQWPIGDDFAADFASEFYARLFPPSYDLWWRLMRRNRLEGVPFAEALRLARLHLKEMGPRAAQTWSSYVFYGDPTRRLVLE